MEDLKAWLEAGEVLCEECGTGMAEILHYPGCPKASAALAAQEAALAEAGWVALPNDDISRDLQAQGFIDYRWFASSPFAVLALAKRGSRRDDWGAYIAGVPAGADLDHAILLVWGSAAKLSERQAAVLFPNVVAFGLIYRQ